MAIVQCPLCGAPLKKTLSFCISCRRAISKEDAQKVGLRLDRSVNNGENRHTSFDLSRKSYASHRRLRTFFLTLSGVLFLLIVYYGLMHFVLHERIPGQIDVWLEQKLQQLSR
jgi:hypothetical protein